METVTKQDERGRKYEALSEGALEIIVGPHPDVLDSLKLPEPFATNLHNCLHRRRIYSFADIGKNPSSLQGALQETLSVDAQRISEAFHKHQQGG